MTDINEIFNYFPVIKLDELILRQIVSLEDYQNYYEYINNSNVASYLSSEDLPNSLENSKAELHYWYSLFNYKSSFYWAIALADTNQMIGTCGFNHWNKSQNRAEISYDLNYKYWNNGIMSKSIKEIINFGFNSMKLHRIQATVAIDNIPSIKMLERVGFHRESLLQKYGMLQGVSKDFYMYVIVKDFYEID
jgi:[ribosomal protein S5]-alanine N-acetyltransferase